MDWQPIIVALIGAFVAIMLPWMNARIAAAKEAAEAVAKVAREAAAKTSDKLDGVKQQLDGRLTEFMAKIQAQSEALEKRIDDAFVRGRDFERNEVMAGPVVESLARVEGELAKQTETLVEQERRAAVAKKNA